MTTATDPYLILRKCQFSDGAEPSGNAIHCENLLRLYRMTLDQKYLNSAEDILKAVADYIEQYPPGYCYHLINLLYYYDRNAVSIVISLKRNEEKTHEIRYEIYKKFLPHKVVIWREEDDEELLKSIPFLRELKPIKNETTLYVCHDGRCEEPTSGVNNIIEKIKKI